MKGNGRWAETRAVDMVAEAELVDQDVFTPASVTKTATYNGNGVELGDMDSLRLTLVVSAHAGTSPTLDVKLQTSEDNATWVDVASFAQQTGDTTGVRKVFTGLDRFVRLAVTIGGTGSPSFTFTCAGEGM